MFNQRKRWTQKRVFDLVCSTIERKSVIFGGIHSCQLCIDAGFYKDFSVWPPRTRPYCNNCPLWKLVPQPDSDSYGCLNIVHKGKFLSGWNYRLRGNKCALKALMRKVCFG